MDRDAGSAPTSPAEAVPPPAPETARTTGLVGVAFCGGAAALGLVAAALDSPPDVLNSARLWLVFVGAVTAGAAVSLRPDCWWTWALAAAAAALGVGGLPGHWDSFRLLFWALAGVGAAGAVLVASPPAWRVGSVSAVILFHFTGIFLATTSPPPSPWLTDQVFSRVYYPYLQFVYLRNAYHFYSPNPGPASVLVFLLKTETGTDPQTGQKQYKTEWVVIPKRPADVRDPLGLAYYRRLSLTEQVSRGSPGMAMPTDQFEKTDVWYRRFNKRAEVPYHPIDDLNLQYRLPTPDVTRYVLPSYASHVILDHAPDAETAGRTTVKVYRLEHLTTTVERFVKGDDPYHPGTYRPFFLGEFGFVPDPDQPGKTKIELVNPQEELLYWLIPVIPRPPTPNDPDDPYRKGYLDYLSVHALDMTPGEVLKADEKDGRVFNWSQLR